jgi:hypothetical protein
MRIRAAIEISGESGTREQEMAIASAYRLSREGEVVLMLNGVPRTTVDRYLDKIVRNEGIRVAGVRYVDSAESPEMTAALRTAGEVIVRTESLWSRLTACGIPAVLTAPQIS